MSGQRNLIVGFDGTWNESSQTDDGEPAPTNVVKFLRALKSLKGRQKKNYQKGVGTRPWEALPGGIYGYGLEKRVQGGYRFLCNSLRDPAAQHQDNRIFVIGFSRGAYSARRLAGLIDFSGIPKDPADSELGWEVFVEQDRKTAKALKKQGRFFNFPIEMLGVWDTVKSTNDPDFHDTKLSDNVVAGYHAMAIDEQRKFFPILRWQKNTRVLQVWFTGVHSDVGGGYANRGLADVALKWMIYRSLSHGLQFRKSYVDDNVKPRPDALLHNSYTGIWVPLGRATRTIRKTDYVNQSVRVRRERKPDYQPVNLPDEPRYWPPPNA